MMINGFNPAMGRMISPMPSPQVNASQQQTGWGFNQPVLTLPNPSDALRANPINAPMTGFNVGAMFSPIITNVNNFGSQMINGLSGFGNQLAGGFMNTLGGFGQPAINIPSGLGIGSGFPVQQMMPPQNLQAVSGIRRTPQQIFQNIGQGARLAFQDLGNMVTQNSSGIMGFGGGMTLASAICPFAGGAVAATGASALANQMANHSSIPA